METTATQMFWDWADGWGREKGGEGEEGGEEEGGGFSCSFSFFFSWISLGKKSGSSGLESLSGEEGRVVGEGAHRKKCGGNHPIKGQFPQMVLTVSSVGIGEGWLSCGRR